MLFEVHLQHVYVCSHWHLIYLNGYITFTMIFLCHKKVVQLKNRSKFLFKGICMITWWNENTFRIAHSSWGKYTGHRWTKDRWCKAFICCHPEQPVEKSIGYTMIFTLHKGNELEILQVKCGFKCVISKYHFIMHDIGWYWLSIDRVTRSPCKRFPVIDTDNERYSNTRKVICGPHMSEWYDETNSALLQIGFPAWSFCTRLPVGQRQNAPVRRQCIVNSEVCSWNSKGWYCIYR